MFRIIKLMIGAALLCSLSTPLPSSASDVSSLAGRGLQVGDKAPDFTLKDSSGKEITLSSALKQGPVVLTWYRGGWCPYCNRALKALSDRLPAIKGMGAELFALTAELPDQSLNTEEKNALAFPVLSDPDLKVSQLYDLVFTLDSQTALRYESRFQLSKVNGNKNSTLPIPATYVIDTDGTIVFAYVNPDYRQRVNPEQVINALRVLNDNNANKLAILWTSGDPAIAENFVGMYGSTAKKVGWFDEVDVILWGPANKLVVENPRAQSELQKMLAAGVKVYSCQACANSYGLVDELRKLGVDVKYMGAPLTHYLKRGYRTLTL